MLSRCDHDDFRLSRACSQLVRTRPRRTAGRDGQERKAQSQRYDVFGLNTHCLLLWRSTPKRAQRRHPSGIQPWSTGPLHPPSAKKSPPRESIFLREAREMGGGRVARATIAIAALSSASRSSRSAFIRLPLRLQVRGSCPYGNACVAPTSAGDSHGGVPLQLPAEGLEHGQDVLRRACCTGCCGWD